MGLTPTTPPTGDADEPGHDIIDLVAAYAADAVGDDDAELVESYLAASPAAADFEQALRASAGSYASVVVPASEVATPDHLRARVLDEALARRRGRPASPATAAVAHRLETERAVLLFRRLSPDQWTAVVDPPELEGWTVHELVAHLASNEALLAQLLGVHEPVVPEVANHNEQRTAEVQARHRQLDPADTLAEYEAMVAAVDEHVAGLFAGELEAEIAWWGLDMRISTALIVRALETWTHADDVRRALSLPVPPPAAPDLAAMSARSLEWVPIMLATTVPDLPPGLATLHLTGPGGGDHTVQLGAVAASPDAASCFELTIDVVDYCRAIANRIAPSDLRHVARGDTDLAERLVTALPALSAL